MTHSEISKVIRSMFGQSRQLVVHRTFIDWTGSVEGALFLGQLIYWSDNTTDPEGWFYKTTKDWITEISITKHSVKKHTKQFVDAGFLQVKLKKVAGAPVMHYRLDVDKLFEWGRRFTLSDSAKSPNQICRNRQMVDLPKPANPICRNRQMDFDLPQPANGFAQNRQMDLPESGKSTLYVSLDDITLDDLHTPPVVPLTQKTGSPPAPTPSPPPLDLEDEVLTFVANAYRRENRRAKLDNLRTRAAEPLRENIRRAETEYGAAEFRSALLAYLSDDSDWLREHRWPIRTFLAQVEDYLPDAVSVPRRSAPRCAGEAEGTALVGNQHPGPVNGSTGLESANSLPHAAQEWNRVVTAGPPVEQWTRRDRGLAVDDPEFIAALPKVLELCQQAFETQPAEDVAWLNFRYLLRKSKGCDVENWYRMATGEFNWLRTRRKTKADKKAAMDDFIERERRATYELLAKYEREEREQQARLGS